MKQLMASITLTIASSLAAAGPFDDGLAAAGRGDYATALKLWQPLADQGQALAQLNVGLLHAYGQGVKQDYAEAQRWFSLAALQGNANAQLNLGSMYANGQGVSTDNLKAYRWFLLAAIKGANEAIKNRDTVAKKMTPQQIEQAQNVARECMASNYKKCD